MEDFLENLLNNTKKAVSVPQFRIEIDKKSKRLMPKDIFKIYNNDSFSKRLILPDKSKITTYPFGYC